MQVKVMVLVVLLVLFNEPFFGIDFIRHIKFYSVIQAGIEATFIAFLLHFWAFLLDTMVASNVRIEPFKFYLPKVTLVFLIWIFITLNAISVKFEELDSAETWLSKKKTILKNGLGILMIVYCLYLTIIV